MNMLQHIWYRLTAARGSGYVYKTDDRDFSVGIFGWGEYKPKHKDHEIKTLSVKDQKRNNNCVFQSTAVQKEVDEGVVLSVRSICAYARKRGLLSGNGWSDTRWGQKVLRDWGIIEEKDCPSDETLPWDTYTLKVNIDDQKAAQHKTQSEWRVDDRGSRLKLLDEGKVLVGAFDWYTGFNQGGGFRKPWLITKSVGIKVGGHQVAIKGYKMDYCGYPVYTCQNSYSAIWGDKGCFYVTMDYLDRVLGDCRANLDIGRSASDILTQYAEQAVKGDKSNAVYYISMGKKRAFPDMLTFYAWNNRIEDIIKLKQSDLDGVPEGEPMRLENSPHYSFIQELEKPIKTKIK